MTLFILSKYQPNDNKDTMTFNNVSLTHRNLYHQLHHGFAKGLNTNVEIHNKILIRKLTNMV